MTLPELMCKVWDGDDNEFFTFLDMNRVEFNANALATEVGIDTVDFIEVTRSSQFRYDEAQKLENLLAAVALKVGITIPLEDAWGYNRAITYADFERWESGFWTLYTALGGTGSASRQARSWSPMRPRFSRPHGEGQDPTTTIWSRRES